VIESKLVLYIKHYLFSLTSNIIDKIPFFRRSSSDTQQCL